MIFCFVLILTQLISLGPHVRSGPKSEYLPDPADTVHGHADNAVLLSGEKRSLQGQAMETLSSKDALPVDPKAPLSAEDLVHLLMQYCNDRVGENVKRCDEKAEYNVKHERDFTDEKLKTLAYHVNKRFNTLDNDITRSN